MVVRRFRRRPRWATYRGDVAAHFGRLCPSEAQRWLTSAQRAVSDGADPRLVAQLKLSEATLASTTSNSRKARDSAQGALELFQAQGDPRGIANAQRWLGQSLVFLGQIDEGELLLQTALRALRAQGSGREGAILRDLAAARSLRGDAAGARALLAQALQSYRESDDEHNVAVTAGASPRPSFAAAMSMPPSLRPKRVSRPGGRDASSGA